MTTKLTDLHVYDYELSEVPEEKFRPAEVSDLVEALQEVGAVRWWTPHRGLIERHKGHLWADEGPVVDGELSPVDRDGHWVLVVPLGEDA